MRTRRTMRAAITSKLLRCKRSRSSFVPDGGCAVVVGMVDDCVSDWLMIRTTLACRVMPPPIPVIISVNVPVGTLPGIVIVRVDKNEGIAEVCVKTPLAPAGSPATLSVTGELNPFRVTTLIEYEVV
jgi:hypothetical protein